MEHSKVLKSLDFAFLTALPTFFAILCFSTAAIGLLIYFGILPDGWWNFWLK